MPPRQALVVTLLSLLTIVTVLELARRRRLREEYALIWLAGGALGLMSAFWYEGLMKLSALLGIVVPTSTVFFLALLALAGICLHLVVRVSELSETVKTLVQNEAMNFEALRGPGAGERRRPQSRGLASTKRRSAGLSSRPARRR